MLLKTEKTRFSPENLSSHELSRLERLGQAKDAIRVAELATAVARTPEERATASAALAGAQQFEVSQKKVKDLQQTQASGQAPKQLPMGGTTGQGGIQVLSDTQGVDFGPYLSKNVTDHIRQNWYNLIPEIARPPVMKKGKLAIEFSISKDGSIAGMRLVASSNDTALDRAAWGGITASSPFPPLPSEFNGPSISLRMYFYYNPGPSDLVLAQAINNVDVKLREDLSSDKNAIQDLEREVAALTTLVNGAGLTKSDDVDARYYRGIANLTLNNLRSNSGDKIDLTSAQQALDDFDRVIAADVAANIPAVNALNAEFYAGQVARYQLGSDARAYSYWSKCAEKTVAGCMYNMAEAQVAGEGGQSVNLEQALDLYYQLFDMGPKGGWWSSYAALRIAKMAYFLGVRRSGDDDPVAWVQKSYQVSDQVAVHSKKKTACDEPGAQVEEFLYRLGRGERQNDLLKQATDLPDSASKTAVTYFSGAIDEEGFEAGVAASKSERDRCYAYFEGMWYAEMTKRETLAKKYSDRLRQEGKFRCRTELVFAKKFLKSN